MYKIFKSLIWFIWLVDILNIHFMINGIDIAIFLDETLPLNFWFWLIFLCLIPSSEIINIKKGD